MGEQVEKHKKTFAVSYFSAVKMALGYNREGVGLFFIVSLVMSASHTYQQQQHTEASASTPSNSSSSSNRSSSEPNEIRGVITSVITSAASSPSSESFLIDSQLIETVRKTLVADDRGGGNVIDDLNSES